MAHEQLSPEEDRGEGQEEGVEAGEGPKPVLAYASKLILDYSQTSRASSSVYTVISSSRSPYARFREAGKA
jgi:hypothetical protein